MLFSSGGRSWQGVPAIDLGAADSRNDREGFSPVYLPV